jgi:HipA-like protein
VPGNLPAMVGTESVPQLRGIVATRYVTPLREGGSLPALVEADDDGLYVLKFRGAGQGRKALVAEVIAGELGRSLGLPIPELVTLELDARLGRTEPDVEIQHLIVSSVGRNLGVDFLPGALPYNPAVPDPVDPEFAADVVWFDALVTNVDRTPRNPNLLRWHDRLWLIDHGAALYLQHAWTVPENEAHRQFHDVGLHVFMPLASSIMEADERLRGQVTEELIERVVAAVPDAFLGDDPEADRQGYAAYLCRRAGSKKFAEEAEGERVEA